ncbi:hypothetical protein NSA50_19470 [Clostridium sp. DSM 100503]|nr:hypothetical protein [Clostridium sp. DSM 100503]MCR1953168.1 hypothetical protein [Clostridium sp. DSM 100503]
MKHKRKKKQQDDKLGKLAIILTIINTSLLILNNLIQIVKEILN